MMEQAKRSAPCEEQKCGSPLARSPWLRGTPVKRNDVHLKRLTYQNNSQRLSFAGLSSHITPPSKLRKFMTRNPFEPDLINRLHLSAISPTIFAKVSSPMQQSPGFKWTIDELARINPAKIEESPMQQVYSPDPELEVRAQAAIDRFFKGNQIIPSPWDIKQKGNKPFLSFDTPNRLLNDLNSIQELSRSTKDAWCQTVLSLPPDLPEDVEEVLKPFFTFTQEQNADCDDVNSSNSSLRRKLFSCHDEDADNDNESFMSLSPIKMNESIVLSCSPPQSGVIVHGTPLKRLIQTRRQSNGSFLVISENLSPPNMSPIRNTENDRLYERIEYCCNSATRLDSFLTDMSTDDIVERKNSVNGHSIDMSDSENNMERTEDDDKLIIINNGKTSTCDFVDMEELSKSMNSPDNTVRSNTIVYSDKISTNEISLKITPEMVGFSRERHKHSNIMSGAFEQQNISNSVQDAGYQTRSMNSITHTIDSCINSTDDTVHSSAIVLNNRTSTNEISLRIRPEMASFSRERHKRSNIMSGAFEQQNISNSVQDTGYQTHSMNSIMNTIDSYSTSTSDKTLWNEKIATSRDNTQLSWRENIRNVFSSTPSKYNKEDGT